jgi:DeoD family purine-nucleoside phosphorylase
VPIGPIHIQPTAPLAERVLLPGDPGRALLLAQVLLTEPKMFNHHRGLWGYTGEAEDGEPMSIQSTGMGGPSAAIVIEELVALGARRLVRVGTCGAADPSLALGDLVVAREAIAADGTSRALGAGERVAADPELTAALEASAGPGAKAGTIISTDLFYRGKPLDGADGALAIEMEAATLFRLAELLEVRAACLLAVSDVRVDQHERIADDALPEAAERLGRAAAAALLR